MRPSSFPVRHISIRVPWHDNEWKGTICNHPRNNTACIRLKNISDAKDDDREELVAGRSLKDLSETEFPPCVKERATFMAPFALERFHEHPYVRTSPDTHAHFAPTRLYYPPFSAAALPFRWMMKPEVEDVLKHQHPLDGVDLAREPELPFKTRWLQDKENHLEVLNTFWGYVRPETSLVFFYAKQVPFVEDISRRVIVGVGRVTKLGPLAEYEYTGSSDRKIRSMLWERMVTHSIREDRMDGFLLPYREIVEAAKDDASIDPEQFAVYAPSDRFEEFSFATEHVSDDSAIAALGVVREGLGKFADVLPDFQTRKLDAWIDTEMGRLWRKRGPFPGLGGVLCSFGVHLGHFAAHAVQTKAGEMGDPWPLVDHMFASPTSVLPVELVPNIDRTLGKAWKQLSPQRREYLKLLARINLTDEQSAIFYDAQSREEEKIAIPDSEFRENPYRLYESARLQLFGISLSSVDRGVFPVPAIRDKHPLPPPTAVTTAVDARRLRALVIAELEQACAAGDTLRPRDAIISSLRPGSKEDGTSSPVTEDLLAVAEEELFADEIRMVKMADGRIAYQLARLAEVGSKIRDVINKRTGGKAQPLEVEANWEERLTAFLRAIPKGADREAEEKARQEKAAALKELARSRFSVLIGPAGTGKTTLLSILCGHPEVSEGHILLLAPTGKARVRMESIARAAGTENFRAATLAQFLWKSGRYDGRTGRYQLCPDIDPEGGSRTVIVDEASMLTEEMLAALLEGISGVHRLILVGDTGQLPPIGAGRPFVDIVSKLQPDDIESQFPRVAAGYVELTIPRRQGATDREDLQLASWFATRPNSPGDDAIFEILTTRRPSANIRFVQWTGASQLEELSSNILAEELGFPTGDEERAAFAKSLGGGEFQGHMYFHAGRLGPDEQHLHGADRWQILSPVRQNPWGIDEINRTIHRRFKKDTLTQARVHPFKLKFPKPVGSQQIVYGDKVINNRNQRPKDNRIYDPEGVAVNYLANGELGIVVGQFKTKHVKWVPKNLEVEFSTQPNVKYTFYASSFDDENEATLELAYALTVHKAQGSEFGKVFMVLPQNTRLLSRELLYTALTRQKEKIIVLHEGPAIELQKLSRWEFSSAARRLTNLFKAPSPRAVGEKKDVFLEERLIHLTERGELVRSKSELIIADHLHHSGIKYAYERPLTIDGALRYPDFTVEDEDTGLTYYWEHCGMLQDPAYRRRWHEKLAWYRAHGILPNAEGGGPRGTLIVTEDSPKGGISSPEILSMIKTVF